ncbi:hypothetical protein ABDK09_14500 [Vibrio sp. CDRSL-10 TSBA]
MKRRSLLKAGLILVWSWFTAQTSLAAYLTPLAFQSVSSSRLADYQQQLIERLQK